ncbi:MAG TPA: malto-oligosyltrehalose synthase [Kofleriaceae bacterium]|nr:malto-oligosyltrehalose synthase [Kofleriaceae bacterium]
MRRGLLTLSLVVAAFLAAAPDAEAGRRVATVKPRAQQKLRPARPAARKVRSARLARHPLSTYRLQLTPSFTFGKAREVLPYLHRLGIRTVYLSPVLQARSGSQHGYDVADPSRVNAELGGQRQFRALAREAGRLGLDLVIDVVPNHMGVSAENKLWDDVLAHGQASKFARYFDIDWGAAGQKKIVVPTLGDKLETILARRELQLAYDGGGFRVRYHDKSFPIDPTTVATLLARSGPAGKRPPPLRAIEKELAALGPRSGKVRTDRAARVMKKLAALAAESPEVKQAIDAALAAYNGAGAEARWKSLLGAQAYRLSYWKTGNSKVNYRRFFTINELAGLRQEDPAVFAATHAKVLDLVRIGRELGVNVNLRIDHPDGMADPGGMLGALEAALHEVNPASQIWVESILAKHQSLPREWPVAGTTGYDFLNELGRAPIDAAGFEKIDAWYRSAILKKPGSSFAGAVANGKRQMLRSELAPDVRFLVDRLRAIEPELSRSDLRDALVDAITAMPVYRTYLTSGTEASAIDRQRIAGAFDSIAPRSPGHTRALALVKKTLLARGGGSAEGARFVTRFQQLSAATMAKGLEDTAHYRDHALAALNEVGGSPAEVTARGIEEFHQAAARRDTRAMLAATTHDTKRSADARTRLAVLTWMPERWIATVTRWRAANQGARGAVDANTEYLAYQTMVALWPRGREMPDAAALGALEGRVTEYMIKAAREGKRKTRWSKPDGAFEADLRGLVRHMFGSRPFLRQVARFVRAVDGPAIAASLSRSVVHYSAPGTADTYQGDELWSFSAVDPDNRRPVDYARRAELLADLERFDRLRGAERDAFVRELVEHPESDRVKLHVVRRALAARNAHPQLFGAGGYTPLASRGAPVLAFARTRGRQVALTIAPQGPAGKDATVAIPRALRGAKLVDQMTGAEVVLSGERMKLSELVGGFPAALLVGTVP